MFTCKYCATELIEHQPNCPNCGAPIKVSESKPQKGKSEPGSIRNICIKYEATPNLYFEDSIDAKRMATVRSQFNIPATEEVIMVYDDTIFGNNKVGYAICTGGLYWKNDWAVDTKRTFLSWDAFVERDIALKENQIDLGRGDAIGVAGVGDDNARQQMVKMLQEIKGLL